MCSKSLLELLNLADDGRLDPEELTVLQRYVDGCAHGLAVRLVVRRRCQRLTASPRLRLRILQSFSHREA